MKLAKVLLGSLFALSLGILCLVAAGSMGGIQMNKDDVTSSAPVLWYALAGFALGVISGVFILRKLSPRTLGIASIGLGSLAFIAVGILLYLQRNQPH